MSKLADLRRKIDAREARIGVIGLGYVGLPLAVELANAGFRVTGFDIDVTKVRSLGQGRSYIGDVDSAAVSYTHSIYRATLITRLSWDRLAYQGSAETFQAAGVCKEGETMPCIAQTDRVDQVITLDARAEYPLRDFLTVGVGYGFLTNQSNGYTRVQMAITPVTFYKHEAWLRRYGSALVLPPA